MSLAEQLRADAAAREARANIWHHPTHANTTILTGLQECHLESKVTSITVHASKAEMGTRLVAHYRIYLGIGRNSVQLNSYAGLSHGKTRLDVRYCPFPYSQTNTTMGREVYYVSREFTVRDVLKLLLTKERDHYVLDQDSGSGCRHWSHVVLNDFADMEWIDRTWANNIVDHLAIACKNDPKWADVEIPMPAPQGRFY